MGVKRTLTRKSIARIIQDANRKRRQDALDGLEERMAAAGCRRLTGREFEKRERLLQQRQQVV